MSDSRSGDITRLLGELRSGKKDVETKLLPLVYDELRQIAAGYLRKERPDHTLQPTALVNEAYIRLVSQSEQNFENRRHFLGIAAHLMRQILVDHARKRNAERRGGRDQRVNRVNIEDLSIADPRRPEEFLALNEALIRLERVDPRQGKVVELRYFGGLTEDEISQILEVSVRTIKRDWESARAWLFAELKNDR